MQRIEGASAAQRYAVYLDEARQHPSNSGFFLDAARIFTKHGESALALRIASNVTAIKLEDRHLLRLFAYSLREMESPAALAMAIPVLRKIQRIAPDEPQSWRDLGLAFADVGQYQEAIDQLWQVVRRRWPDRFPQIDLVALNELNTLAARARAEGIKPDLNQIDPRLQKHFPVGLRVALIWDANDTDVDLHITDPLGETASYRRQQTTQGGLLSQDYSGGYGPEEFLLRQPASGKYEIYAHLYGTRQQVVLAPITVQARISTDWGTPKQVDRYVSVRIDPRERKQIKLGEILIQQP